jgi:hypothetical protein
MDSSRGSTELIRTGPALPHVRAGCSHQQNPQLRVPLPPTSSTRGPSVADTTLKLLLLLLLLLLTRGTYVPKAVTHNLSPKYSALLTTVRPAGSRSCEAALDARTSLPAE